MPLFWIADAVNTLINVTLKSSNVDVMWLLFSHKRPRSWWSCNSKGHHIILNGLFLLFVLVAAIFTTFESKDCKVSRPSSEDYAYLLWFVIQHRYHQVKIPLFPHFDTTNDNPFSFSCTSCSVLISECSYPNSLTKGVPHSSSNVSWDRLQPTCSGIVENGSTLMDSIQTLGDKLVNIIPAKHLLMLAGWH